MATNPFNYKPLPDNTQAPVQMNFRNSMQAYQDALPMNQMPTQTFKPHKNINEN